MKTLSSRLCGGDETFGREMEIIISQVDNVLSYICLAVALAGSIYAIVAKELVRRFSLGSSPKCHSTPAVTALKPLHGDEPHLYDCLRSFCRQNYAGPLQIIFGVGDPSDPAVNVVRRLMTEFADADISLVIEPCVHGANRKIANLINMSRFIRHDILVVADSDIQVSPDYLSCVVGALESPGTGMATCLYCGAPGRGIVAHLAAMAIDYHFLPSILVGLRLGMARPAFGSTIALSRQMYDRIGGFRAFADQLADDNAMGEAVRRTGARVAVPCMLVAHVFPKQKPSDLLNRELRWARTIRAVDGPGFLAALVIHPLPFALAAMILGDFDAVSVLMVTGVLYSRLNLERQIDAMIGKGSFRWALGPLRDLLSFLVHVASFFVSTVKWRDQRYKVSANGTLVCLRTSKP